MKTMMRKPGPSTSVEVEAKIFRKTLSPAPTVPRDVLLARAYAELATKGVEEIEDHLSLVAQIQVRIGRLLATSIDELERARRLEALTSFLLAKGPGGSGGSGTAADPPSENAPVKSGDYLGDEIRILKKMQRTLGLRPADEVDAPEVNPSGEPFRESAATEPTALPKVLIVNRDPGTIRILKYFLEKEPYDVLTCSNGAEAFQKAVRGKPDLILLDLLLPEMDGYQVLSRLKKDPTTARIPVYVLSVLAQEADILKAFEYGAADYFTKPFSPPIVVSKIRRALRAGHV
jgi:CheY-like chemotaxis protein